MKKDLYPIEMLVDSRADISLITRLTGEYIGLEIEKDDKFYDLSGVVGEIIPVIIKKIKMKIGDVEFEGKNRLGNDRGSTFTFRKVRYIEKV